MSTNFEEAKKRLEADMNKMLQDEFVVKPGDAPRLFPSGMHRSDSTGKPNYNLIDLDFLTRFAMHLTRGAEIHGKDNWRKANSQEEYERFQESAFRHLIQWLMGLRDEDHACAVVFNLMCAEHTRKKLLEETPSDFFAKLADASEQQQNEFDKVNDLLHGWMFNAAGENKIKSDHLRAQAKAKEDTVEMVELLNVDEFIEKLRHELPKEFMNELTKTLNDELTRKSNLCTIFWEDGRKQIATYEELENLNPLISNQIKYYVDGAVIFHYLPGKEQK